jgi:outer membrane usher protein
LFLSPASAAASSPIAGPQAMRRGRAGSAQFTWLFALALLFAPASSGLAQVPGGPPAPAASLGGADEDLIVVLRANGVDRGEVVLRRTASGDFWITAQDFPKLKMEPVDQARRQANGEAYFSFAGLGAQGIVFDEAQLTLAVVFPARGLERTHIDLSNRPAPIEVQPPRNSAILNYRAAVRQGGDEPVQLRLTTELNLRVGELLLRQEAKYDSGIGSRRPTRGPSQLIWDDRRAGNRFIAGDVLVAGGPFGTTFPGAGISLSRLYAITPDVIRQPGAAMQVSTLTPADVEVSVDGNTIYRTHVGPGPITLDNLYYNGGARTVRVTVTDATGRRQVIEQPFLFTDTVLAKGLHEYSYFIGRRSELGADDRWHYREGAWQAFHRYGASDSLTVEAGGEGSSDFASGGVGASLRNDLLGLLSLDLQRSLDRTAARRANGWSARYSYSTPNSSLFLGRRGYGDGFRTFANTPENPALLSETRMGASTRVFSAATLSADLVRGRDIGGERSSYAVRLSTNLGPRTSLQAEYQSARAGTERDWGVNVSLRFDLDRQQWVNATVRSGPGSRGTDLEAGRQLAQGEGVGYRVGITSNSQAGEDTAFAFGSANWNLKPVTLEFNGTSQLRGGRSHYAEAAVSGAIVGLDGYVGLTRQVGDGFALARLGVAQPGVDIFLNNQVQGKTDAQGNLLIPQVGAYGRQDVSLDDKQLPMQYSLGSKRVTIAPPYKSGTVVDFGGHKLRAVTGSVWLVRGGERKPIASRSLTLAGESGRLAIDTAPAGDFYLEDAAPGRYSGAIEIDGKAYSCHANVPDFPEAVHELQQGIVCE